MQPSLVDGPDAGTLVVAEVGLGAPKGAGPEDRNLDAPAIGLGVPKGFGPKARPVDVADVGFGAPQCEVLLDFAQTAEQTGVFIPVPGRRQRRRGQEVHANARVGQDPKGGIQSSSKDPDAASTAPLAGVCAPPGEEGAPVQGTAFVCGRCNVVGDFLCEACQVREELDELLEEFRSMAYSVLGAPGGPSKDRRRQLVHLRRHSVRMEPLVRGSGTVAQAAVFAEIQLCLMELA